MDGEIAYILHLFQTTWPANETSTARTLVASFPGHTPSRKRVTHYIHVILYVWTSLHTHMHTHTHTHTHTTGLPLLLTEEEESVLAGSAILGAAAAGDEVIMTSYLCF